MDPSLLLSSLVAPIVVGVGVGWISNRWSSSHGWLRAEVESRSNYYAEVLVAGQELREALPHMYHHAALLRGHEPSADGCELGTSFLEAKTQIERLAEKTVAKWRGLVKKAPLYAAAVVLTPVQASEDALDRLLGGFHEIDPLQTIDLRRQILHMWTLAIEGTIERDMVDLRLSAIRGLPWRQRRAEKSHLKEMSAVLESRIAETVREISVIAEELERVDQQGESKR